MEENGKPDISEIFTSHTVGEMLTAERRRQGKSLSDIAEATCIRLRMLQDLEEGVYERLPSPAYVKGYIQNYATALSMSAEPFLEAYRSDESHNIEMPPEAHPALSEPILPRRDQVHQIPPRLLLTVVAVIALVAFVWITLRVFGGSQTEEPAPLPPTAEESRSVPDTETAPGITGDDGLAAEAEETAPEPFSVTVSVEEDDASWLRVTADGIKTYEGTLGGGESRTWEASDVVVIRIGRPSVVTITKDGQPVDIPTETELPTVEITAE